MKLGSKSLGLAIAALVLAGLSACSGSGGNKLVGQWEGDVKAMMASAMPAGQEMPPGMTDMLKDSYIKIEFKADGTNTMSMKMMGQEKNDTGKWELLSQEGSTYKLKLTTKDAAGAEKTTNATAVFTDDDNFKLTMDGEAGAPPMILKRKG